MKTLFYTKTLIAVAVAVAVAAAADSQAQEQPIPPPDGATLPAGVLPATPLAEVVKLAQAGVDAGVIKSYIANSAGAFNLNADLIIALADAGVPSDIVNAMMAHDKNFSAAAVASAAPPAAPANVSVTPPPAESAPVTVNYFYNNLAPYGSWVEVEGYGRCWRPTVVVYDSTWRPYCDRGRWVYTDCGWYWDSDYAWGVTFHYGRWFHHPRMGWCWWPDTVWGSSWVSWRSTDDYCGWAPLPPFTEVRPGLGFFYRGAGVTVGFDFGLEADCFTFVSFDHFCERHPRYYRVEPQRVPEIFRRANVVNNFNVNNRMVVNAGISVEHIRTVGHRAIAPVTVSALPNAGRQGWRGNVSTTEFRHGPVLREESGFGNRANHVGTPEVNAVRPSNLNQPSPVVNHGGTVNTPGRPAAPESGGNHFGQREFSSHNSAPAVDPHSVVTSPANNHPAVAIPAVSPSPAPAPPTPRNNWSGAATPFSRNPARADLPVNNAERSAPAVSAPAVVPNNWQANRNVTAPAPPPPRNNWSGAATPFSRNPARADLPVNNAERSAPAVSAPPAAVPNSWQPNRSAVAPTVSASPKNYQSAPAAAQGTPRSYDRNSDKDKNSSGQNH